MKKITDFAMKSAQAIIQKTTQSIHEFSQNLQTMNIPEGEIQVTIEQNPIHQTVEEKVKDNSNIQRQIEPEQVEDLKQSENEQNITLCEEFLRQIVEQVTLNLQKTVEEEQKNHFSSINSDFESSNRRNKTEHEGRYDNSSRHINSCEGFIKSSKKSRLLLISQEKKEILRQLEIIDQQIVQIKGQKMINSFTKKIKSQMEEQKAVEKAQQLIEHYRIQKKQKEKKKKRETQALLQNMRKEEEQFKKYQEQLKIKKKEEKKRSISLRMQDVKQKQKERKQMDKQSNILVNRLKKQQQLLKQQQMIPEELLALEDQKKSMFNKKQDVNFNQIKEHERKYISKKYQNQVEHTEQRSSTVNRPAVKYAKNHWASMLEIEETKKKNEEKQKALNPKIAFERRMKYGELIQNIFAQSKDKNETSRQKLKKPTTPEMNKTQNSEKIKLPKISQSQKKINDSKIMKKFRQNKRMTTSPDRQPKFYKQKTVTQKSPQERKLDRQKQQRLYQLKKQTDERLKKLDNFYPESIPVDERPHYKNYLGTMKLKRKENPKSWKKIIQNTSLSQQQVCDQMMKKVAELQIQAKRKEQRKKEGRDQESIDIYLNSIQAKLAILEKI